MDRNTFFRHLRRSRLLPEPEVEAAERLPGADEPRQVARALVKRGLLTRYQARRLLAGKGRRLTLGQYRLLEPLGRGAMGRVFKALHTTMARVVAVKVILPGLITDHSALDLFNREVRAAAHLSHPNIVTAYDANEVKGVRFLVMEYVDGPSLHDLLKAHGPLPVEVACDLMAQAAAALQYAHEQGMVHRDIKPANLLLARLPGPPGSGVGPLVKVVDFGLARIRGGSAPRSPDTIRVEPGAVFGTVDYISPEQANDVHAVDIRSDLYSLGCVFYHTLAGRVPFPDGNSVEKLLKQLINEPRPLQEVRPDVPAAVEAVVQRLMAKDRARRYQTPAEVARELAAVRIELRRQQNQPPPGGWVAEAAPQGGTTGADTAEDLASETGQQPADRVEETSCLLPASEALTPTIDASFRDKFRKWASIIEHTVRRRSALRRLNHAGFAALQRDLVAACQAQARVGPAARREFFQGLANLLQPWLTPEALAQTDLEIHCQLAHHFREAERELDRWAAAARRAAAVAKSRASVPSRTRGQGDRRGWTDRLRKALGLES
jgi:serine/threonine protein kinase